MKGPAVLAIVVAAGLSAAVWALSIPITGKSEPWDAEPPLYYVVALTIAGVVGSVLVPKHPWAHYVGAIVGQAAYELAFLKLGPLFVFGLPFLAIYSLISFAAAAIVISFRKNRAHG